MSIPPGHYAQKQLHSRSALVRWTHGSRFRLARELVAPLAGRRLLDYGCGDGTFLSLVQDLFPAAVGADIAPDQVADCTARFAGAGGISFTTTDRLAAPAHAGRYEIVVCMEVLEHCPDDIQEQVLDRIREFAATDATIVFSVPIEIGPALLVKQCTRALVARRGLSEYADRERYTIGELTRLLFAGTETIVAREECRGPNGTRYTGHKGFNWRRLEGYIQRRFDIQRRLFSPLPALGPWFNTQVWFVCQKPRSDLRFR